MAKKKTTKKRGKKKAPKSVETLTHDEASRKNIPTAEFQSVMARDDQSPIRGAYERHPGGAYTDENPDPLAAEKDGHNRDLDPQLVWRGKDEQDWSDLVTHAPPLFIQEKVHPKVLIDDLLRRTQTDEKAADPQMDLFADFNGLPDTDVKTEFCRVAEAHPKVYAYVKNHNLGFEVPYQYGSTSRRYRPDFIILVDDGHPPHDDGTPDRLHLVVEVKGYRREDAKEKKSAMETYWAPGVNNLKSHGRWAFAEFCDVYEMQAEFEAHVEEHFNGMINEAIRAVDAVSAD